MTLEESILLEEGLFREVCTINGSKDSVKAFLEKKLTFRADKGRWKWKLTKENFKQKV